MVEPRERDADCNLNLITGQARRGRVRMPGKRLKAWNKHVYYAVKFTLLLALVYFVFFFR